MNQKGDRHKGYEALRARSTAIMRGSMREHRELIEAYLSAIDLYVEKLNSFGAIPKLDEDEHFSLVTRVAFLSLGIGHAKATLDAACRGEYHHAFFSIRFMGELLIQGVYIRLKPAEARRWYKRYAKGNTADFAPSFDATFRKVRRALTKESAAVQRMFELVGELMSEANKWGAHPSQEILVQIMAQSDDRLILGPRYDQSSCRAALDRGLLMTLLLVEELFQDMMPDGEEDIARRKSLWDERLGLMKDHWNAT